MSEAGLVVATVMAGGAPEAGSGASERPDFTPYMGEKSGQRRSGLGKLTRPKRRQSSQRAGAAPTGSKQSASPWFELPSRKSMLRTSRLNAPL